jgi:hypothetical protein
MMQVHPLLRPLHRFGAWLSSWLIRKPATFDPVNFRRWEARGYHVIPTHFYFPVPDTRELGRETWKPSDMPGVDWQPERQVQFLREACLPFQAEYNEIPAKSSDPYTFKLDNDAFTGIDPLVYYCMIRHFKPRTILEIGSGHSSLLAALAAEKNGGCRRIIADPYPRYFVEKGSRGGELIKVGGETLDLRYFESLEANDILFIDSSHVVRIAGEVNRLFLEALPRLKPGVVVHVHDIFLPYEYPRDWVVNQMRFWDEQYLLQAYLAHNARVEVLLAHHYLEERHVDVVKEVFPRSLHPGGVSFWFRTK